MTNPRIRAAMYLLLFVCLTPVTLKAQEKSNLQPVRSESDRLLKDLLEEVRQLRMEMRATAVNSRRAQLLLDRLKIQQEQEVRLTREIGNARDGLVEVRARQAGLRAAAAELDRRKALGVAGEAELRSLAAESEEMNQREQSLLDREARLSADLSSAQVAIADLNKRLDELERDFTAATESDRPKPKTRDQ